MKNLARPVLATACLVTMTAGAAAAVETELQKGPDYFVLGAEILNQHYDQGVVRNENATAHATATVRLWDIGLHGDGYFALDSDNSQTPVVHSAETTEIRLGIDYLIEMPGYFQVLPHFNWIEYANVPNRPYKDDLRWLGIDAWYQTPVSGLEVGASLDYNAFYNGDRDNYHGQGTLASHAFTGSIGARQFWQHAPVDLTFWEVLNFGNGAYKEFLGRKDNAGATTIDFGIKYVTPFYLDELWVVTRLELHIWAQKNDRDAISAAGRDPTEVILGVGFEWIPGKQK